MPAFEGFEHAFDPRFHYDTPEDWYAVVADIKGSSEAVEAGKYKQVNIAGASCIVAVLNAAKGVSIPYVFGGDGASFLIPPFILEQVSSTLLGTQVMVRDVHALHLRVGIVPIKKLYEDEKSLRVSKFKISQNTCIAMFHGGGLSYAEKLVKNSNENELYTPKKKHTASDTEQADFSGLECRWNPIAATKDHILTLMVKTQTDNAVYKDLIEKIDTIFKNPKEYHPVKSQNLNLSFQAKNLRHEFQVKTYKRGILHRAAYALKMVTESALAKALLAFDITMGGFEGKKYLQDVTTNTDFQKFDDTFRIVLDSTKKQHEELQTYLEDMYQQERLFYGLNVSSSVMMTCLVFNRKEDHIHFVDGMAGGYTDAAQKMKRQMA